MENEDNFVDNLKGSLENCGFLSAVRSDLKILALKTVRKLAENGDIETNEMIQPVKISDNPDEIMIALIRDFFGFCGLEKSLEMLDLELDKVNTKVKLEVELPQIGKGDKEPYLTRIITRAKERTQ